MNVVEFEAVPKDDRIEIPARHAAQIKGPVRVIVLYDAETDAGSLFDDLMDNPARVPAFIPLSREETHGRR